MNHSEILQQGRCLQAQGNYEEAEQLYRMILQREPQHLDANFQLGTLAFQLQQYNISMACMIQVLQQDKEHKRSYYYLARSLMFLEQFEKAKEFLAIAIQLDALWCPPYLALGSLYRKLGEQKAALHVYDTALDAGIQNTKLLSNKANCLLSVGDIETAIQLYEEAIELQPKHFEIWNNKGQAQVLIGDLNGALQSLQQASSLDPGSAMVHRNIAYVYHQLQEHSLAKEHAETSLQLGEVSKEIFQITLDVYQRLEKYSLAVELAEFAFESYPQEYSFLLVQADSLNGLKQWDDAIQAYKRLLKIHPQQVSALHRLGILLVRFDDVNTGEKYILSAFNLLYQPDVLSIEEAIEIGVKKQASNSLQAASIYIDLGNIYQQNGNFLQAVQCYKSALKQDPNQTVCYRYLAGMRQYIDVAQLMCEIERVEMEHPKYSSVRLVDLYFAKGMLLETLAEYPKAFKAFEKANQLHRETIEFCIQRSLRHITLVKKVHQTCPRINVSEQYPLDVQPIFIVGMIRSGSSLLAELLSAHSMISSAGESAAFSDSIEYVCQRPDILSAMQELSLEQLVAIRQRYQEQVRKEAKSTTKWIINKLNHNYLYIGLIKRIFPEAKIVHIQRNPIATGLSIYQRYFAEPQNFAYSLEDISQHYKQYQSVMQYWLDEKIEISSLQYENMVAQPKEEIEQLIEAWGLSWEEQQLQFHQNKTPVMTASVVQVRQPIYQSSLEKWKNYLPYIEPLLLL